MLDHQLCHSPRWPADAAVAVAEVLFGGIPFAIIIGRTCATWSRISRGAGPRLAASRPLRPDLPGAVFRIHGAFCCSGRNNNTVEARHARQRPLRSPRRLQRSCGATWPVHADCTERSRAELVFLMVVQFRVLEQCAPLLVWQEFCSLPSVVLRHRRSGQRSLNPTWGRAWNTPARFSPLTTDPHTGELESDTRQAM